jgi:glycerol uptake operon antiterminator
MNDVISKISQNPIIAATRKEEDVNAAVLSAVTTVFLLHADIFNINCLVDKVKGRDKNVLIHIDFLEGLGRDSKAIDYIAEVIKPDGILTTRSTHVKHARDKGIFTVQRFFLVDSLSFDTMIKTVRSVKPDMIEIMPAVMPGVIKRICSAVRLPVIAGGLIDTKEDIIEILKAGAMGVSTGKKELWGL